MPNLDKTNSYCWLHVCIYIIVYIYTIVYVYIQLYIYIIIYIYNYVYIYIIIYIYVYIYIIMCYYIALHPMISILSYPIHHKKTAPRQAWQHPRSEDAGSVVSCNKTTAWALIVLDHPASAGKSPMTHRKWLGNHHLSWGKPIFFLQNPK